MQCQWEHVPAALDRAPHEVGKNNPHWPCDTQAGYRLFAALSDSKTSDGQRRDVGKILASEGLLASNEFKAAERRLAAMPQARWQERRCTDDGDREKLEVHYRDIVVQMASVLRNPRLDPTRIIWGPELCKDSSSGPDGYLSDVCHGLWWKAMQRACNPGVVLLPIIITQDESQVDTSGRRGLIPVYATLANVPAQLRNQAWARVVVGYLRKPNKNLKPAGMSHEEWKRRKRDIKQKQMAAILEPLRTLMRTGVRMVVPNRQGELVTATVVPLLALASYDQPEIKSVTNVKDAYKNMHMFCHRCATSTVATMTVFTVATIGCRGPIQAAAARSGPAARGAGDGGAARRRAKSTVAT